MMFGAAPRRIRVYWAINEKYFEVEHANGSANGSRNLYAHPFVLYNVRFVVDVEEKYRPSIVKGERNVHAYAEGDVVPWVTRGKFDQGVVAYRPASGDTFRLIQDASMVPMPISEIEPPQVLAFEIVRKHTGERSSQMLLCGAPGDADPEGGEAAGRWLSDPSVPVPVQRGSVPWNEPAMYPPPRPYPRIPFSF